MQDAALTLDTCVVLEAGGRIATAVRQDLSFSANAYCSRMLRSHFVPAALVAITSAFLLCTSTRAVELPPDAASFSRLHALIKPKATEQSWVRIPWMTSLWEARRRAATEGKPILLWEMDGHPLGCT